MLLTYGILWRVVGISPLAVSAVVWRPVVACLVMSGAVLMLLDSRPRADATFWLFVELVCTRLVGALVYFTVLLGLWRICGMPPAPENMRCSSRPALRLASDCAVWLTASRVDPGRINFAQASSASEQRTSAAAALLGRTPCYATGGAAPPHMRIGRTP